MLSYGKEHKLKFLKQMLIEYLDLTRGWGYLYNKELNSYPSRNIIELIKSRTVSYTGHIARVKQIINKRKTSLGRLGPK
jgi:hypothetical protein